MSILSRKETDADLVGAGAGLLVLVRLDVDGIERDSGELRLEECERVGLREDGVRVVDGDVGPEIARVGLLDLVLLIVHPRLELELDVVSACEGTGVQEDLDVRGRHAHGEALEVLDEGGEEHVEGGRVAEAGHHERVDNACDWRMS